MPSWGPSVAMRSWLGTGKADSVAIKRQVEPEAARDASPSALYKADPVCGRNPNTEGNQNVRLLFAVAGELLSRGKNKLSLALSAASWGSLLPSSEGGLAALFSFPAALLRL